MTPTMLTQMVVVPSVLLSSIIVVLLLSLLFATYVQTAPTIQLRIVTTPTYHLVTDVVPLALLRQAGLVIMPILLFVPFCAETVW